VGRNQNASHRGGISWDVTVRMGVSGEERVPPLEGGESVRKKVQWKAFDERSRKATESKLRLNKAGEDKL